MRRSSPSTLNSVPAYFAYRIRSPTLTSIGSRLPSSRTFPGPAARIVPSIGFSFAVSGRTMPLLVMSSRGVGLMTTRSPRGFSFLLVAVALANAQYLHGTAAWRLAVAIPGLARSSVVLGPAPAVPNARFDEDFQAWRTPRRSPLGRSIVGAPRCLHH